MIKGTGICLSLWIMGCMLHVPVNSAGNDVKADDRVVFTVQTVEKRGESVSLVGRISRRPGSAAMFWGGRTFLTVCCYDGDGKRLSTDDQIWAMFSIDDFNERGVAEATFCFSPPVGAVRFSVELPGAENTQHLTFPVPGQKVVRAKEVVESGPADQIQRAYLSGRDGPR